MLLFQSTPPVWTETSSGRFLASPAPISIHSARVGGDTPEYRSIYSTCLFQSTPPVWAETLSKNALQDRASDFNPLRPCGRRHARSFYYLIVTSKFQSTPPVWAETPTISTIFGINCDFNPLRPCGRRRLRPTMQLIHTQFQSTPPVWAETGRPYHQAQTGLYFNPLRPCGRRLPPERVYQTMVRISIHSARVGGDFDAIKDACICRFQSTPPVWAETLREGNPLIGKYISIHSARVGGDQMQYPRSYDHLISIHSARVGGDSKRNHFFVS